jgi:hypothetical protein
MIQIETQEQFTKAAARARRGRLFVAFVRFRQYRVRGRSRFGGCDGKAGGNQVACKHLAAGDILVADRSLVPAAREKHSI